MEDPKAVSRPQGFAEKLELLKFYRAEDAHEWSLLTSRIAAYITSQSFLMLTFASAMNNSNPRFGARYTLPMSLAISLLGLLTSYHAHLGIAAACDTLRLWRAKQRRLFFTQGEEGSLGLRIDAAMLPFDSGRIPLDPTDANVESIDRVHKRSLGFAVLTPYLFGAAWLLLGILTVAVHFG